MKRNSLHYTPTFQRKSTQLILTSKHKFIYNVSEASAYTQNNLSFRPANRLLFNTPAHV